MHAVRWLEEARIALQGIWDSTPLNRRPLLKEAIEGIQVSLRDRPYETGESRDPGFRIAFVEWLAVVFAIDSEEQVVYITEIKEIRR